jgi:hypothetical protein
MEPISAILSIVDACLQARDDVVQNRQKSERLMDALEAVKPSLRALVKANPEPIAHEETLIKLKATVEDARALLKRQRKRNRFSHIMNREFVRQEFAGITLALDGNMAALNLSNVSMGLLGEESAETGDDDASDIVAEMQGCLKELTGRVGGFF